MRNRRVRWYVMGGVLTLALVALPTRVAQSADTLYACVNQNSGAMHFVSVGTTCKSSETLMSWNIVGPTGPPGSPGLPGPAGPPGASLNPLQIAILRWYEATTSSGLDYAVGSLPYGVAFDGTSLWVTNSVSNTVTKLRASDGTCNGVANPPGSDVSACSVAVGSRPRGIAFDGANVWVANYYSATVSKR